MQLGEWYSKENGVQKDPRKAAYWYLQAARAGNADAQQYVVEDYELGNGVRRSHANALVWYRRTAPGDGYDAAGSLMTMYEREGDAGRAAEWMRVGARAGSPLCQYRLAEAYQRGSSQSPRDPVQALGWYLKVADRYPGFAWQTQRSVEYAIAEMYSHGEGVEQSYPTAIRWYGRAVTQRYNISRKDAEYALGELYAKGLGTAQDYRIASVWYQKAADDYSADAGLKIAELYERGLGVPQSDRRAMDAYFTVATRNSLDEDAAVARQEARARLFGKFESGAAVPQDDKAALQWYRERANAGDVFARRGLALSYEVGYRVAPNHGVSAAIESELERDGVSADDDPLRKWISKAVGYRRHDLDTLLVSIHEPGEFLSAIDDFVAHARLVTGGFDD